MRLFIAVDVPEEVSNYFFELQKKFPSAKQTLANSFHLTLKFLGDVPNVEKIIELLSRLSFSEFTLTLDRIGFFPSQKHPMVIWVGVTPHDKITALQKQVDEALKSLFTPDHRFHPHLTLARIKEAKNYELSLQIKPLSFKVSSFVLYESKLSPKGPTYSVIREFKTKPL